ncbi:hypothetical protein [Serratia ficaria]|nr:hypothetical protein [Serratia ficaria]
MHDDLVTPPPGQPWAFERRPAADSFTPDAVAGLLIKMYFPAFVSPTVSASATEQSIFPQRQDNNNYQSRLIFSTLTPADENYPAAKLS